MAQAALALIERRGARLDAAGALLGSLGYHAALARGYALVRDGSGATIRSAAALHPGMALALQLADGTVAARTEAAPAWTPPKRRATPRAAAKASKAAAEASKAAVKAPESAVTPAEPAAEQTAERTPAAPPPRQGSLFEL